MFHLDESSLYRAADFKGHTEVVESLQWSPTNDQLFVSASCDKSIRIWDVKTSKPIRTEKTKEENLNIAFNADGSIMAVSNDKEELNFYDCRMWKQLKSFKVADKNDKIEVIEFAWDKSGQLLLVADSNGSVRVFNGQTLNSQPLTILDFHNQSISALAMGNGGDYFITGGYDSLIALWDLNALMVKKVITNNDFKILALNVSHDDKFIAQISEDDINKKYFVEIYDVQSGETAYSYNTVYEKLALSWHPKKYILAVGGEDRKEKGDKNEKNEGMIHLLHPQQM